MATKDEQDDQAGAEEPDSFGLVECRVEAFDGDEEPRIDNANFVGLRAQAGEHCAGCP